MAQYSRVSNFSNTVYPGSAASATADGKQIVAACYIFQSSCLELKGFARTPDANFIGN